MILPFESFITKFADVSPLVAVNELVLDQCTVVLKSLPTVFTTKRPQADGPTGGAVQRRSICNIGLFQEIKSSISNITVGH